MEWFKTVSTNEIPKFVENYSEEINKTFATTQSNDISIFEEELDENDFDDWSLDDWVEALPKYIEYNDYILDWFLIYSHIKKSWVTGYTNEVIGDKYSEVNVDRYFALTNLYLNLKKNNLV